MVRNRKQWEEMLSKSFSPLDWFAGRGEDYETPEGGSLVWVFRKTEPNCYTVGFYSPDGKWNTDSDHETREDAAARVHYLNGGGRKKDGNRPRLRDGKPLFRPVGRSISF